MVLAVGGITIPTLMARGKRTKQPAMPPPRRGAPTAADEDLIAVALPGQQAPPKRKAIPTRLGTYKQSKSEGS